MLIYIHIYILISIHIQILIYIHICILIYIHKYTHIQILIYIHIYTLIYSRGHRWESRNEIHANLWAGAIGGNRETKLILLCGLVVYRSAGINHMIYRFRVCAWRESRSEHKW